MKVGHKIAIIYSAMTLCVAGLFVAVLYYWMSDYSNQLCYSYLEERAYLIAQKNLNKYSTDSSYFNYIQRRADSLTRPVLSQIILDADNHRQTRKVLSKMLNDSQTADLYSHSEVEFKHDESLGVAIYLPKTEGNFIVIVTSGMHFGSYMHRQMGYWLAGVISICAVIVFLVSKLYALRRINTLDDAYHREKQFVYHASHELNNPLTAIQGECEITLMKPRTGEEYVVSLGRIGEEASRMTQIIRQLLYLASAKDDSQGFEKERIDMADFVTSFASERVKIVVEPSKEGCTATANRQMLKIAFEKIVNNALKYSADNVLIRLSGSTVTISDKGIGIPNKELKYILQPFFRASNTHSYKGSGIGLSLAERIFTLYGIRMSVSSESGRGTSVILKF